MAEEPYDDLDIGYVEWPMPTTEEFEVVRFLNKQGVARFWQKIKDKFVKTPSGGEVGQALVKTETGVAWGTVESGSTFPEGGTPGQALIKTEDGVAWGNIVTEVDPATDTTYGTVKFVSDEDFDRYFGIT